MDAVELIDQVVQVLSQAQELELSWSGHVDGEAGAVAAMRQEWEAVRGGELRMSVVAPMKAGKSTLVNAIVGYELLPARAAAMTTLPTRIVLDRRLTETELAEQGADAFRPVLDLREQDAVRFDMLVKAIRNHVAPSQAEQEQARYPHLAPLIEDILAERLPPTRSRYEGRVEVQDALTLLNDLMRLAGRVLPAGWRVALSDVPVVHTPYWAPAAGDEDGPGRLVVVDTPGPDEHDLSEMLGNIVSKQLSESHIVLVVLDYTKMGGQSDARIRQLMEPLLDVIGPDKLFAVVNKIDQKRHETDLGNEGIVRSVTANLGLSDAAAGERIYTTSAEWALASVRTLTSLKAAQHGFLPASDESSARLLKLVYPMDWQEELEDIGTGRLTRVAQRAWEFSQIDAFLASAVAHLRRSALRLAIEAALTKAVSELADLEIATTSRRDLIGRRSQDLARAVGQISDEIAEIAGFRGQVTEPAKLAERLAADMRKQLHSAREQGDKVVKKFRSDLRAAARSESTGLIDRALKTVFRKDEDALEFTSAEDAGDYIRVRTLEPKARLDTILERSRKHIELSVGASAQRLVQRESELVRPVVERAAARVKDEFDLTFTVPELDLQGSAVAETPIAPEAETRHTTVEVEREIYGRSWRTLWMWRTTYLKTVDEVTEEHAYVVAVDALADSLQKSFHTCVHEIEEALSGHVRDMVTVQVDHYYDGVEAFLQRYRGILQQSAEDNELEELMQNELRENLNVFLTTVRDLRAEVEHVRAV
ncbi:MULTISPECIES: dynamin family protein [unclassified Streptomyces]|uniref:dynamin family protein n=1 Tax=unclassified Streptomyces TaxID=2593676 RepID=UPI00324C084F